MRTKKSKAAKCLGISQKVFEIKLRKRSLTIADLEKISNAYGARALLKIDCSAFGNDCPFFGSSVCKGYHNIGAECERVQSLNLIASMIPKLSKYLAISTMGNIAVIKNVEKAKGQINAQIIR